MKKIAWLIAVLLLLASAACGHHRESGHGYAKAKGQWDLGGQTGRGL